MSEETKPTNTPVPDETGANPPQRGEAPYSPQTTRDEFFERGRRLALEGGSPPPQPGWHTPWRDWQVWRGFNSVAAAAHG
jgi:hypothetical protein